MSFERPGFNPENSVSKESGQIDFLKDKLRELKGSAENREGLARLGDAIAITARFNRVLEKLEELISSSGMLEKETASMAIRDLLKDKEKFDEEYNLYTKNHQEMPNDPSVSADKMNEAQKKLKDTFEHV